MTRINSLGSRPGLFASVVELMSIRRAGLTALSGNEVKSGLQSFAAGAKKLS